MKKQSLLHMKLWLLAFIVFALTSCNSGKNVETKDNMSPEYSVYNATSKYAQLSFIWRKLPENVPERLRKVHVKVNAPSREKRIWRSLFERGLDQGTLKVADLLVKDSPYDGVIGVTNDDKFYIEYFRQRIEESLNFDNLIGRCVIKKVYRIANCELSKEMYGRWVDITFIDQYIEDSELLFNKVDEIVKDYIENG